MSEYEAWIHEWSFNWTQHKTNKGQQLCRLAQMKVEAPTVEVILGQRLLVEYGSFVSVAASQDLWATACKKQPETCKNPHDEEGFVQRCWLKAICAQFVQPISHINYVIQSKEDWNMLMDLLIVALRETKSSLVLDNILLALDAVLHRPANYDCCTLCKCVEEILPTSTNLSDAQLTKLAQVAITLASESAVKTWFTELQNPRVVSTLGLTLFNRWRANGVTGSAAAEKLSSLLQDLGVKPNLHLSALRLIAISGSGASLAHNQSNESLLSGMLMRTDLDFDTRYNACLLICELFPRQSWKYVATLVPVLTEAQQLVPFLINAFALHDVPELLKLIPACQLLNDAVLTLCEQRAMELTKAEAAKILSYVESSVGERKSLLWIALVLVIMHAAAIIPSSNALEKLTQMLNESSKDEVPARVISVWAGVVANFLNAPLRDSELALSIHEEGHNISYRPNEENAALVESVEKCAGKWREITAVRALLNRVHLKVDFPVFEEVIMSRPNIQPLAEETEEDHSGLVTLVQNAGGSFEALTAVCGQVIDRLPSLDWPAACEGDFQDALRKLINNWNHLLVLERDAVPELFEKHVEAIAECLRLGLGRLCELLCVEWRRKVAERQVYSSPTETLALQKFYEHTLALIVQSLAKPVKAYASLLDCLWFDRQFCPLMKSMTYIIKTATWFYNDPDAPLSLKVSLSQQGSQLITYVPRGFRAAKLPTQCVEQQWVNMWKQSHKKVTQQLAGFDLVSDRVRWTEEEEHNRELVNYILSAIKE